MDLLSAPLLPLPALRRPAGPAPALIAAALLLAGCGTVSAAAGSSPSTAGPSASAPSGSVSAACPGPDALGRAPGEPDAQPLPAGIEASAVVVCRTQSRSYAGEGTWTVLVEQRATTGLQPLVTALHAASEPRGDGPCTLELVVVDWFAVVDASGRWWHPAIPQTSCGKPQPAVVAALGSLDLETVSETRLHQDLTPEQQVVEDRAAALGCESRFKDMIRIEDDEPATPQGRGGRVLQGPAPTVTVCRYDAGADAEGTPMLSFVSGERRTGSAASRLVDDLEAGPAVRACSAAHQEVVGLFTPGGDWVLVETDGCRRVLGGSTSVWRQATPELLAALR